MEHDHNQFSCLWCAEVFPRRFLEGRKPHYCSTSCRQRAYEERRRGARFPGHPRPTFVPPRNPRRQPISHESGRNRGVRHALRAAGLPDRWRRRPTLCGTWASAIRPTFGQASELDRHVCLTCHWLAAAFPPTRQVDPVIDVAVLTHLIRRLPPRRAHRELFTYCGLPSSSRPPLDRSPLRDRG